MQKTIFITGASAGIGAACARAFAAHGDRVILSARREDRLRALADELDTETHLLPLDVRDPKAVESAIEGLPGTWKEIDVLLNNAGLARGLKPVYEQTPEEIDEVVDTNVKGVLYLTQAVVPGMIARGRGHVIFLGSIAGHHVYPGGTMYCATKFAINALCQGLKMDLHGTPIRVSSVDPGLVETDFSITRFYGDTNRASSVYADTEPLTAEDVADAVVFCATRPAHVNISDVVMMPVVQSSVTMLKRG